MALHVGYETAAGAVFAAGAAAIGLNPKGARAVGLDVSYGIALMLGGVVFWLRLVIGVEPDREMLVTFGTAPSRTASSWAVSSRSDASRETPRHSRIRPRHPRRPPEAPY